jgi:serine/threonine protein kinase
LGAGFFGEVWLAHDQALGLDCAVKFVPDSKVTNPSNFFNEPKLLAELVHSNIVKVMAAGRMSSGELYVQMEFLENGSLEDQLTRGPVTLTNAVSWVCDSLRGLGFAHEKGYVHADIKPGNILLGDDRIAKLSDFGLAGKLAAITSTSPPKYAYLMHLAPEMLNNRRASVAGDIYAMGMTIYRLINGDSFLPTLPDPLDLRDSIRDGEYPDRSRYRLYVPTSLRRVVNRALDVDPHARFQSAVDFRHALEKVLIQTDFEETYASNTTTWIGTGSEREWRIHVEELRNGGARVGTSSSVRGRVQNHPKLSRRFSSLPMAEKHIAKLLQNIVQGGPIRSLKL